MEIRELKTARERRQLLLFPHELYKKDPLWVPPLLPELEARIDPRRGKFYKSGQAEFFGLLDRGRLMGTISVGHDGLNPGEAQFGFLEYRTPVLGKALLKAAESWARERGFTCLRGPFNLDTEDSYGVLVEGRDRPPTVNCGHGQAFYPQVMEESGYQAARADNIALELRLDPPDPELVRLAGLAEVIRKRGGFEIRHADFAHMDSEIDGLHGLLNRSLAHLPDFHVIPRDAVVQMVEPFTAIADPELILMAEKAGRLVGFLPGIPDLNQTLGRLGGLRYPWQWLGLPFALKRRADCLCIKSILVEPSHWGAGLGPLLIAEMYRRIQGRGYSWVDLSLTSLDNPYTPALAERLGGRIYKRYRVYQKQL